jgi:hypothetical protein
MNYTEPNPYFPNAHRYRQLLRAEQVSEPHQRFGHSERHLQCLWFDPRLRPDRLHTAQGEPITVIDPGRWNLEAGPDFRDAVLLVGIEKRRISGDAEIHISSNDWTKHGHGNDPRYQKVRFHITYYNDPNPADLPPGTIHIPLADGIREIAGFHFEDIDLAAYPFNHCAPLTPCSIQFAEMGFDAKRALLEAAGEERLLRRALRFTHELETKTPEQLFYEQMLYALGFKNNRQPFRELAQHIPAAQLTELSKPDAYAALLGISNLIPTKIPSDWSEPARLFARDCWQRWFHQREKWEACVMPSDQWQLANLRPLNHPVRRIAAAAEWFAADAPLFKKIIGSAQTNPENFGKATTQQLTATTHPFWSQHESWKSAEKAKPVALIGKGRADTMLINIIVPMLAALDEGAVFQAGILQKLPLEPSNSIIRETAHRLFGADHPSALYKTELARQGLIQIFQDHCLSGTPSCDECALAGRLKNISYSEVRD